jgi:protein ImuA
MVVWAVGYRDLFAPALAGVGLHPDRVVYVEARDAKTVLLVMEESLRHAGLAAVVGEVNGVIGLTASRRLQLAAEKSGVMGLLLRRPRRLADDIVAEPTAARTRWRVSALPSGPALPWSPKTPGLARARWQLDLVRVRGGEPKSFVVEACDAKGSLSLVADMADGQAAEGDARRSAVVR